MTRVEYFAAARLVGFTKLQAATLIIVHLLATVLETFGLAMMLPVFQFIESKGDVNTMTAESDLWKYLVSAYDKVGLEVTLPLLLTTSLICILLRQVFVFARQVYQARLKENLVRRTRDEGFTRYLHAKASYQDSVGRGEIMNSLTTELVLAIETLLTPISLINFGLLTLVYVVVLAMLSFKTTLVAVVLIGISGLLLRHLLSLTRHTGQQLAHANRDMSRFLSERLNSVGLVRLSGTERPQIVEMATLTARQCANRIRIAALSARVDVLMDPIVAVAGILLIYVGHTRFGLQIEEIGMFLLIVLRLLPVVKEWLRTWQRMLGGLGSLEALIERFYQLAGAREHLGGSVPFLRIDNSIRFNNVDFHYTSREGEVAPALHDICVTIPAGSMTALVGPSGAGKSTLIDLLPRVRDPVFGTITIDGTPLQEFDTRSLRAGIAYAPQTPQIFNVSAAEHIRYGRVDATEDEVRVAARLAGAEEFLDELTNGFETMVGESGVRLSGGQRQRLDLARALVTQAPVLILDEPTSNLDAESEALFRDALERIHAETDTTIIIVGHRLMTVTLADQIVVLKDGRIEEVGPHSKLLQAGGWYASVSASTKPHSPRVMDSIEMTSDRLSKKSSTTTAKDSV